jgi:hypothetical protein
MKEVLEEGTLIRDTRISQSRTILSGLWVHVHSAPPGEGSLRTTLTHLAMFESRDSDIAPLYQS